MSSSSWSFYYANMTVPLWRLVTDFICDINSVLKYVCIIYTCISIHTDVTINYMYNVYAVSYTHLRAHETA